MALTHAPAHHIDVPDVFTDETTGQFYAVLQDLDAEDPRGWVETEHAALWAYNEPKPGSSTVAEKPEGNLAIDAFERFYEAFGHDHARALDLTRRWLAAFHAERRVQVETRTIRGYSQGDWLDVVAAVAEGHGAPQDHLEQLRQWAFGDVWVVIPDGGPGVSGIYADDAEAAVAYYRENTEDEALAVSDIDEDHGALDPLEPSNQHFLVSWQIDSAESVSPAHAALRAWRQNFRRGSAQPSAEDACVFDVSQGDRSVEVDLSDPRYAHLFEE